MSDVVGLAVGAALGPGETEGGSSVGVGELDKGGGGPWELRGGCVLTRPPLSCMTALRAFFPHASQEGLGLQPMMGGRGAGGGHSVSRAEGRGQRLVCRGLPRKDQRRNQPEDTDSANRRERPGPGRGERLAECEGLGGPGDFTGAEAPDTRSANSSQE